MARAYLRNRLGREDAAAPQNPILGFLDINFGVLGIFLIVFTLRLVVVSQPAGSTADLLLVMVETDSKRIASYDVYHLNGEEPERFSGETDEITGFLMENIQGVIDTGLPVAKLMILLPASGYHSEIRVSNALSKIERTFGEGYLPFISTLRPVTGDEHIVELVAAWRDGQI